MVSCYTRPMWKICGGIKSPCRYHNLDDLAVSIWTNMVNWVVPVLQASDPISVYDVISSLFLTANDILTCSCLSPDLILVRPGFCYSIFSLE